MLASELISKKLIVLSSAQEAGTVANVLFDTSLSRGKLLHVLCDSDRRPEHCYVPLKKVSSVGDACVVKTEDSLLGEWETDNVVPCPINRTAYAHDGELLGRILDVELDKDKVCGIVTEKGTFSPDKVVSFSDGLLVLNTSDKPLKIPKPRKNPPAADSRAVTVHKNAAAQTEQPAANAAQTEEQVSAQNSVPVPSLIPQEDTTVTRSPLNYPFLLGKPVHAAIADSGRILIPAGTVVTQEVIDLAKRHGKLVQLALRAY